MTAFPAPFALPTAFTLAPQYFENLINTNGVRLAWMKSHVCACTYGGPSPGTPDRKCVTCKGRGYYWDNPVGPFIGLITFIHTSPTPDEPGTMVDENYGLQINGEPALTIPATASGIWDQAAVMDLFVEIDAVNRYNAQLRVGANMQVPYQQSLTIPATGAVTYYDSTNHVVVSGISYSVSGAVVTPSGLPSGTNYIVEFDAAPTYVAFRIAGMPAHVRPFAQLAEPRRFRLQQLDLWTRARSNGDIPVFVPSVSG